MFILNADPTEPISDPIGCEHFLTQIADQIDLSSAEAYVPC